MLSKPRVRESHSPEVVLDFGGDAFSRLVRIKVHGDPELTPVGEKCRMASAGIPLES